jgi:hypothetical protein
MTSSARGRGGTVSRSFPGDATPLGETAVRERHAHDGAEGDAAGPADPDPLADEPAGPTVDVGTWAMGGWMWGGTDEAATERLYALGLPNRVVARPARRATVL